MKSWISFRYISFQGNSIPTAPTITMRPRSRQISRACCAGAGDLDAAATITQSAPRPPVSAPTCERSDAPPPRAWSAPRRWANSPRSGVSHVSTVWVAAGHGLPRPDFSFKSRSESDQGGYRQPAAGGAGMRRDQEGLRRHGGQVQAPPTGNGKAAKGAGWHPAAVADQRRHAHAGGRDGPERPGPAQTARIAAPPRRHAGRRHRGAQQYSRPQRQEEERNRAETGGGERPRRGGG